MTGAETAAAAAAKAAEKALAEDATTKAQLSRMAEDTPEMRAAAKSHAKSVAIRQRVILKMWEPLGRLSGFSRDYFTNDFEEELTDKLKDVPDDQLQPPRPIVAVPAVEALGYSLDEPTLKDMYLNLIANASDKRMAPDTHPSFAQVIRQLSSEEAAALPLVLRDAVPFVRIERRVKEEDVSGGEQRITEHPCVLDWVDTETGEHESGPRQGAWIDNWIRLGLVEKDFGRTIAAAGAYDFAETRPETLALREAGVDVVFDQGVLFPTDFGRRFAKATSI